MWATTVSPYGSRFAFSTNYGTPSSVPAGLDYDLELYGPSSTNLNQHLLTTSVNPAGVAESIVWNTSASGYFAVRVLGYQGAFSTTATYTITRTQ